MAIRRVLRMGHPQLRQRAEPVPPDMLGTEAFERLLTDMHDTLRDYGGIGLAAPQIGEGIRLAIIELPGGTTRYGEISAVPLTVFVNPEIEVLDGPTEGYWEGCLSVPGLRGFVERPQHVRVCYTDTAGEEQELVLDGFPATVVQHEFDHLDGVLYIDRIDDTRRLAFDEEFNRYVVPG